MLNNEFTFGSSSGIGANGSSYKISDTQLNNLIKETEKNKNIVYV